MAKVLAKRFRVSERRALGTSSAIVTYMPKSDLALDWRRPIVLVIVFLINYLINVLLHFSYINDFLKFARPIANDGPN